MNRSLVYILAASLREIFPAAEIDQMGATHKCFFCDVTFPEGFNTTMIPPLEERMRQWVGKKVSFNVLTMMPSNAAQMLEHHGDKKLAQKMKKEAGEVTLLQLDRFFFQVGGEVPVSTDEASYFKLVCFWPLKQGVRLLGVGAMSKEVLKEQAQGLKTVQNPQNILENQKYVSWIGEALIWEPRAEGLKAKIKKKILDLYQGFDEVMFPDLDERGQRELLLEWMRVRKRGGVRFQKKKLGFEPRKEPWDLTHSLADHGWGHGRNAEDVISYLHLIRKFLTIFDFECEIVSVGKMDADLGKVLRDLHLKWTTYPGKNLRLEFQVMDQLGCRWTLSTFEWDRREELVQVTLCVSLERCIALLASDKTLLNRLKQLES